MKLAYPVAEPAYTGKVKAYTGGYEAAFSSLQKQGYQGVELLIANPDTVQREILMEQLERIGLKLAVIGTSPMQIGEKLFLLHPDPENRREARRRMSGLIALCAEFEVPAVIGKYRGQIADAPGCREGDLEAVLKDVCAEASSFGVPVLIEPQNATNINNIHTIQDGLDWIQRIGYEKMGLLADIYHMGITEHSIVDSLRHASGHIGFIHMSGSDRKVPGDGTLPIGDVVKTLEETGYSGYISLEIDQIPDPVTASGRSASFLLASVASAESAVIHA